MKSAFWIGLSSAVVLAIACGGQSISEGDGESGGAGDAGAGGTGSGAKGGGGNVGANGGTGNVGTSGSSPNAGSTSAGAAGSGCRFDSECVVPGVCMVCSDGSASCAVGSCANGSCQVEFPPCPGECQSDMDCGPAQCIDCDDGTACSQPTCVDRQCVSHTPTCPMNPCEGLACGDPCYQNFPSGSDPAGEAPYMTCDRYGDCVYGIAQCEAECEGPEDCALPEICIPCAGGSCAEGACQAGLCTTVCPSGRQPCTDASDCPQPPPICIACPAGGCQGVSCIENECRMTCATDGQCLENLDCPACETCFTPTDNADVACWPSSCQFGRCYTPCN